MSHRVDILKSQEPRFPDLCVHCDKPSPGAALNIKGALSGSKPSDEDLFASFRVDIPCCPECQGAVRRHRFVAKLLFGASVAAALVILFMVTAIWPALTDSWLVYPAILASVALPSALVDSIHVAPVVFTPSGERLIFEFRDRPFAEAFAELNDSKVA